MPDSEPKSSEVNAVAFADHEPRESPQPTGLARPEASALNLYLHGLCALFIYAGQRAGAPGLPMKLKSAVAPQRHEEHGGQPGNGRKNAPHAAGKSLVGRITPSDFCSVPFASPWFKFPG
jgi:hypothetical protein